MACKAAADVVTVGRLRYPACSAQRHFPRRQPGRAVHRSGRSVAATMPAIPTADLAPGLTVSRIVKGCWQLSGGHKGGARDDTADRTSGRAAVEDFGAFLDGGVTAVDTADIYGPSERLIGDYVRSAGDKAAQMKILTKCCFFYPRDMAAPTVASVRQRIEASTQALGRKPDLVQLYWHDYKTKKYSDAALALTELKREGLLGHVGLTNFDMPRVREMVEAGAEIAVHQVQYSLLDRRPENGMSEYCQRHGITLLPYGVLAGGFLTDKYLGVSSAAASKTVNTYSKSKYSSVIQEAGGWDWFQALLKELRTVADRHSTDIAAVATRWVLSRPAVPAVLIGARNASHVPELQRVFAFELTAEDLAGIYAVLQRGAPAQGDCYEWERGGRW